MERGVLRSPSPARWEETDKYLNGGERRLVEALEVAAHLALPHQVPPALPQRQRPAASGIPRRHGCRCRCRSVQEERGRQGQRDQARPRSRHRLSWHSQTSN